MSIAVSDVILRAQIIAAMKKFTYLLKLGGPIEELQEARDYIKRLIDQLETQERQPVD